MPDQLLHTREDLPAGLLDCPVEDLHTLLKGPTLIHLPGRRPEPLFVSVLLHGNEPVGMQAMQQVLKRYQGQELPRALSLFIGNVSAAARQQRRLDGQPDYNRIWAEGQTPEHAMAAEVVAQMRQREVFASIDVHNNTGLNPHYGCVNRLDHRFLRLATNFSRTVVYFTKPEGVQTSAFADFCPAVTLECGQPEQAYGVKHAAEFLDTVLNMARLSDRQVPEHDIDLFHTVALVKVPTEVSFGFDEAAGVDLCFEADLDHMNFRELTVGTVFGQVKAGAAVRLEAMDEQGEDRGAHYFSVEDGVLKINQAVMPSMLTLNEKVIRQDCLCYLMERLALPV
ncbi:M14 family metallopeptidase [Sulfuriflexus mobilis]|uniref:M14 family metallopeptidase n=1 Tax=Sulfuriflexus mobilis TaxID=1811807 RepID=UPI000F84C01C|nr:M14 family metallopeptidase [Sulfuriflexus mobilis]